MPFTPSHAIAALPFLRTPLVPAAIAIGAMTPDLPLFLRGFGVSYAFTHTYANIVWTAVVALGLFLLWRVVLRPAAGQLAPAWLADRLPAEWDDSGAAALVRALGAGQRKTYALWLAASLLLGVLSHILWDAFTHEGRLGLQLIPGLAEQWGPLQGYKWLQHGSSIIALLVLAVCALIWLRRAELHPRGPRRVPSWVRIVWWLSLPMVLIVAWCIGYAMLGPLTAQFTLQHLAYRTLPAACGIWAILTLVLCVGITIWERRKPTGAVPQS